MNVTRDDLVSAWGMVHAELRVQQLSLGQWCCSAQAVDYWGIVHEKTLEVFALELEQSALAREIRELEEV